MQKSIAGENKHNLSFHEGVVVLALFPADVHALPLADVVLVQLPLHVDRLLGRNVGNVGLEGEGVIRVSATVAKRVVKAAVAVVDGTAGQLAADVFLAEAHGSAAVVADNVGTVHGDWVPPHVHGWLVRFQKVVLDQIKQALTVCL